MFLKCFKDNFIMLIFNKVNDNVNLLEVKNKTFICYKSDLNEFCATFLNCFGYKAVNSIK